MLAIFLLWDFLASYRGNVSEGARKTNQGINEMDRTQAGIVTATVVMILLVLLFGSPVKRKVQIETNADREQWREGRIDGKSESALTKHKKTAQLLAFVSK